VLVLTRAIERSRFGAQLVAVRENEEAAQALGVDALGVKLEAIALSAAVTAAAGGLLRPVLPLHRRPDRLRGPGSPSRRCSHPSSAASARCSGPLVGAFALHGLGELAKIAAGRTPGIDLVVFGLLLVVAVGFAPTGILGLVARLRGRRSRTSPEPARAEEPA
jgi:branched-chain amino acid transport system permease protein